MPMNFSAILDALNQASAFELFRLRAAIHRKLDDPHWITAITKRLKVGQEVEYFSFQDNAIRHARIIELRRKNILAVDLADNRRWLIDYASINIDGADVQVREQSVKGLGRNEVEVGQIVGFVDRNGNERSGHILRLNDKTVTIQIGSLKWRVSYGLLHRVVDSSLVTVIDLPPQEPRLLASDR
ncbi:conserved hypothetical protein [Gammaproteobacteria bacterium]